MKFNNKRKCSIAIVCIFIALLYLSSKICNFPRTLVCNVTNISEAHFGTTRKDDAPLVTLFTSWRTFPKRYEVYNNTLRNWLTLQPHVKLLLFTNDKVSEKYKQLGWTVLPIKHQIKNFTVLKSMFLEAMELIPKSKLYGFSNGDLLFTGSFVDSLLAITKSPLLSNKTYMVVGRRLSTPKVTREEASSWENIQKASKRGKLMPDTYGIDYFITTPKYNWKNVPDLQIGRAFYDNWVVYDARRKGYSVIDATGSLLAVHQDSPFFPGSLSGRKNNFGYINNTRAKLSKGVIRCCDHHTIYTNQTTRVEPSKKIPRYCRL
ncbi:uncharacterized protein [Argopecten irradians]|uniref:uncharacterized protein n=1 Tax=Argopecten irradians TaxID=31199 RepID=UPI0037223CC7